MPDSDNQSKLDSDFLSSLLHKVQKHSTIVGKVWLTVLFFFRLLVLTAVADAVWGDEQSNFLCDTNQPGCQNVCYDKTFPISHTRFWMFQFLVVLTPNLIYLCYINLWFVKQEEKEPNTPTKDITCDKSSEKSAQRKLGKGKLKTFYIISIIVKFLLELAFILGHCFLYGFELKPMYTCDRWPCLTTVFCYVSRPTEKTIFINIMFVVSCVSLLLNLVEMIRVGTTDDFEHMWNKNQSTVANDESMRKHPSSSTDSHEVCFVLLESRDEMCENSWARRQSMMRKHGTRRAPDLVI